MRRSLDNILTNAYLSWKKWLKFPVGCCHNEFYCSHFFVWKLHGSQNFITDIFFSEIYCPKVGMCKQCGGINYTSEYGSHFALEM